VEAAARRILGGRPSHPLALKALGFALIGQGRYDDALPIVRFSLERNPDDPEAHNNLGIVLSALMRWDESIQCFARSIEIKPDDPEVLKNYGVALVEDAQVGRGGPVFSQGHRVPPWRLCRGDRAACRRLAVPAIATMKPGPVSTSCGKTTQQRRPFCRNSFAPASSDATGTSWSAAAHAQVLEPRLSLT
jgi:tetratricopeptide (TPR) repeat protein